MTRPYTKRPVEDRFWEKVAKGKGCWLWTASIFSTTGYGQFHPTRLTGTTAHRWAYEQEYGPVSSEVQIDHKCHNESTCVGGITCLHRICVRPSHLRAVSPRVNTLAGKTRPAAQVKQTHCKRGHPFDEENTYRYGRKRTCRTCRRQAGRDYYAAHIEHMREYARKRYYAHGGKTCRALDNPPGV